MFKNGNYFSLPLMCSTKQYLLICFSLISLASFGQSARKYSNAFLEIGVDARAMGMGSNFVAITDGAYSGYWNPAGISRMEGKLDFGLMHAEYFAGIAKYDYLGGAYRLDEQSVIGLSVIRFGVDNILNTTRLIDENGNVDYDRITKFSAADYAFIFSYSRQVSNIEGLSYGANFKVIYRQIGDFADAYGFGLDAGIQYHKKNWRFGGALRDVTTTVNSWTFKTDDFEGVFEQTGNELPKNGIELTIPRLVLGVGYLFEFGEDFSLLTEIDLNTTFDGQRNTLVSSSALSMNPGFGFELGYADFIFFRGGINKFQRLQDFDGTESLALQPSVGVGVKFKKVSLDYALTDIASASGALYSNIFSLRLSFD